MTSSDEGSDIRRRDAAEEGSPMVVRLWEIETEDADPPPVLKPRRRRILQSPGNKDIANAFFFSGVFILFMDCLKCLVHATCFFKGLDSLILFFGSISASTAAGGKLEGRH